MCGKEGYQFIKHTQKEYKKSKKRLNNQINQFILKYKGKKVEEPFNKLIKALIINFNLDIQEQKTLKIFLTTFKLFMDS